jgi:hypothetical protein
LWGFNHGSQLDQSKDKPFISTAGSLLTGHCGFKHEHGGGDGRLVVPLHPAAKRSKQLFGGGGLEGATLS